MNINELFERIINDTAHANEVFNRASAYFWSGDIEALETLLESNPDSSIILQYIALYKSLLLSSHAYIDRPVNQNINEIRGIISTLESAIESLNRVTGIAHHLNN